MNKFQDTLHLMQEGRLLLVDDQEDILTALELLFKSEGFQVVLATFPSDAINKLKGEEFDLTLMDMNYSRDTTSGQEGLELLKSMRQIDPTMPVVVMTAWGTVDLAVQAMQSGANDFVEKPWDNNRLLSVVRNQLELKKVRNEVGRLRAFQSINKDKSGLGMVAESKVMQPVLEIIHRVGPSDAPILIRGENGTGKGLAAQAIHRISQRSNEPFVTVNMGGVSEGVFESELFGHVRGAFTDAKADRMGRLEMAGGGTLFLDEIANTPPTQQAKVLRVLETGEFEKVGSSKTSRADVRFISATNAELETEVKEGRFRKDLLFRLNTVELHLPPLRERTEDIVPLAEFFLEKHRRRYQKSIHHIHPSAVQQLMTYTWPGNVRELNHVIERAILMSQGTEILPGDLGLTSTQESKLEIDEMSLEEVEQYLIKRTLARYDGNARKACEALGLSRSAFYRRLEKYEL